MPSAGSMDTVSAAQYRGEIMTNLVAKITAKAALKIAAAAGIGLGLTGCVYDAGIGLGYASDNYANNAGGYGCDPYSPFDSYYDCDYRYGFGNIGFGGGWFNNYYYPGNGFFLFDNYGRRFNMQRDHFRYWGQRRYEWNRGRPHHNGRPGNDRDGNDHRDGDRGGYYGRGGHGDNIGGQDRYESRGRYDGRTDNRGGGYPAGRDLGRGTSNGLGDSSGGGRDYKRGAAPVAEQPNPNAGSVNPLSQPRFTRSGYIQRSPDGDQNSGDQNRSDQRRYGQDRGGNQPENPPQVSQASQVQSAPERSESVPRPERSRSFGGAMRQPDVKDD